MDASKNKNILLLVEGAKKEKNIYNALIKKFDLNFTVVSVCCNILMLYQQMKKTGFYVNVVDVLKESKDISKTDKEKLENNFAFIYLIFDFDLQAIKKKGKIITEKEIKDHYVMVEKMTNYFNDETDDTKGKMYVNYPMVESFYDYNKDDLEEYKDRIIGYKDIENYKRISSERGCYKNYSKYSKEEFLDIIRNNIKKVSFLSGSNFAIPYYDYYECELNQEKIVKIQQNYIEKKYISIVNSGMFIVVDYFGNKNKFYDDNINIK